MICVHVKYQQVYVYKNHNDFKTVDSHERNNQEENLTQFYQIQKKNSHSVIPIAVS